VAKHIAGETDLSSFVEILRTEYLNYPTEKFKTDHLHKNFHIVILSDEALKESGTGRNKEARAFAQTWGSTKAKSKKIRELNKQNTNSDWIVVSSFEAVRTIFGHLRLKGLIKSGKGEVHRGHVVAGTRIQAETAIEAAIAKLDTGADNAIVEELFRKLKNQARLAAPTIRARSIQKISSEAAELGIKMVLVMPELGKDNISKEEERILRSSFEKALNAFVEDYGNEIVDIANSKSYMQAVDAVLDGVIAGGKKSRKKFESTNILSNEGKVPKAKKPKVKRLPPLRDVKGRFTSAASIQQLLQAQIAEQVKDNMGLGGALVNRTGRFAESVTITNVTQTRQGSLTTFYNYMKYPYQTFERGFKQGSTRRDPRLLIHKSIREIAQKLVHNKLNIKTRRV
jgi:hypothetical protein